MAVSHTDGILKLDDEAAVRALGALAAGRLKQRRAGRLSPDARLAADLVSAARTVPAAAGAGELARAALRLVAEESQGKTAVGRLLRSPPAATDLTAAEATTVVLQKYFRIAAGPGDWQVELLAPTVGPRLKHTCASLAGHLGVPPERVKPAGDFAVDALGQLSDDVLEGALPNTRRAGRRIDLPQSDHIWVSAARSGEGLPGLFTRALEGLPERQFSFALESIGGGDGGVLTVSPVAAGRPVPVLVKVDRPDRSLDAVTGFRELSRLGRMVSGLASPAALVALAGHRHVAAVEVSGPVRPPDCAVGVPFIRATAVHTGLSEKGDRALVGVIDVDIDVLHQAFLGADGKTRVVGVWDQRTEAGTPPPGQTFGTYHTRADIDGYIARGAVERGLGDLSSPQGHGTHVASIAAGRACDGADRFSGGVAPEARLAVVVARVDPDPGEPPTVGYSTSHLAALSFLDWVAEQEGLPVVVNVSMGAQGGGHDGRSLLELGFDEFSNNGQTPGRVVVKSAGNDGENRLHATVQLTEYSENAVAWDSPQRDVLRTPTGRRRDVLDCWFDPIARLRFRLQPPGGGGPAEQGPEVGGGNPRASWRTAAGNDCTLRLTRFHPDNGASHLRVTVEKGTAAAVAAGKWTLQVYADQLHRVTAFDAWIDLTDIQTVRFATHEASAGSLSVPGTARSVIAVGAVQPLPAAAGDRDRLRPATFSSAGATRDGRNKPELSAPGLGVLAAAAGTEVGARADSGTSMAAPFVAGAVALVLSRAAKAGVALNTEQVRSALVSSTRLGSGWHPTLGYGVVDVAAVFQELGFG